MKTITLHRLKTILENLTHATPVGVIALTTADCRAKGPTGPNPWGKDGVKKLTRLNAMIGTDHELSIQRQQAREGQEADFLAAPRSWGVRIGPGLVEHRGQYYLPLQLSPVNAVRPLYLVPRERGAKTILTAVPKEIVAPWLSPARDERVYQGVVRPVVRRDLRLDSIVSITLGGEKYRIRS
jgi:hypothetical protein